MGERHGSDKGYTLQHTVQASLQVKFSAYVYVIQRLPGDKVTVEIFAELVKHFLDILVLAYNLV